VPSAALIEVSQKRFEDGVSPRSKASHPASIALRPAETISLRRTPSCRAAVSSAVTVARCRSTVGARRRAGLWCSRSNSREVAVSTNSAVRESTMDGCSSAWRSRSIDPSIIESEVYSVIPAMAKAAAPCPPRPVRARVVAVGALGSVAESGCGRPRRVGQHPEAELPGREPGHRLQHPEVVGTAGRVLSGLPLLDEPLRAVVRCPIAFPAARTASAN
jgi:hypothetical protein